MRIVFFGEDSFSATALMSLINSQHEILAVFCPIYKNYIHVRLEKTCENKRISFYRIKNINSVKNEMFIKKLNPDLILVCHFQKILKPNIFQIPLYGCINLHPSLLPKYKGLSPQHWPIIKGDKETGITVHFINKGIDTGDIILQHKILIDPHMYVSDLQFKMLDIYKIIFNEAISLLMNNNINFVIQNPSQGSYFGKLREEQCLIDLNKGHLNAYNLIRGVSNPYFGAKLYDYRIWKANIASKELNKFIQNKYNDNDIYFNEKIGNFIKFNDGSLIIEKIDKINDK